VEAEKEKLQQQLFQSQKMESVGRLAGGIAHDFNNLLTGIMGYASLSLKALPEGTQVSKNIETIIEVSKRASHLVKQLLLFSRKIPLEFKVVDVNNLIRENVGFIRRMVEETVEIKLDLQDDLPVVKSDVGQLTQVLINFAVNARDAMDGKGTLVYKTERAKATDEEFINKNPSSDIDEYIVITVTDTGCGIDEENLTKIFDPFYSTKEVGKGTGLGLSIVYSIVTGHDGWIDVKSVKGEGSSFIVYLPVMSKELSDAVSQEKDKGDGVRSLISGKETILIVEDEEVLRSFSSQMLTDLGYNVLMASDGDKALDIFRENQDVVDLVVSDMVMPNKSGIELFNDLRELQPDVKFILVTGYCLEEAEGHVLRDMEAILMKPYTTEKIAALIRKVLEG
jgi:nitrogen-specific signal transduction histidine kinase/CheY-like chemotaxis protein